MKKYLKTPEEVISALKAGKTVYSDCGKYKMIDGFIVYEGGGICNINANLTLLESPFVKEAVYFTFGTVHILHFFFQFRDFIFNDFYFFGGHIVAPVI